MKRLCLVALGVAAACSGESADESTRSDGGGENGGASGSSSSGAAGIALGGANGAMGGTTPTSTGGVPATGGSSGSSGADASGGIGGSAGTTGGDGGNAGEGATGGQGGGSGTCGDVTTLAECDARDDCHSVFVDPNNCPCDAPGCCARFSFCGDGDRAVCDGMVTCRRAPPICLGRYVISYDGTCYEGCVRSSECAP